MFDVFLFCIPFLGKFDNPFLKNKMFLLLFLACSKSSKGTETVTP